MTGQHPIAHIEFSAMNLEESARFYHDLFGWEFQHIPEMHYATFTTAEGSPGGGLSEVSPDSPAGSVSVYIQTDDINETLRKAESMGAHTTVPRTEIPGVGWFAYFKDLTGNSIGLLEPLPEA